MIKDKITKSYFEKYNSLKDILDNDFLTEIFGTKEKLIKLYLNDHNLNQIPLTTIDKLYPYILFYRPKFSLAESCCAIKHILIYNIIEAKPEFIN